MPFFAEIGPDNTVIRVIVATDADWCVKHLGGTWVETKQNDPDERYASRGDTYDPTARERFRRTTQPVREPIDP